jgi:hypothetical protein
MGGCESLSGNDKISDCSDEVTDTVALGGSTSLGSSSHRTANRFQDCNSREGARPVIPERLLSLMDKAKAYPLFVKNSGCIGGRAPRRSERNQLLREFPGRGSRMCVS